jgi:hypothetical protein
MRKLTILSFIELNAVMSAVKDEDGLTWLPTIHSFSCTVRYCFSCVSSSFPAYLPVTVSCVRGQSRTVLPGRSSVNRRVNFLAAAFTPKYRLRSLPHIHTQRKRKVLCCFRAADDGKAASSAIWFNLLKQKKETYGERVGGGGEEKGGQSGRLSTLISAWKLSGAWSVFTSLGVHGKDLLIHFG